MIQGKMQQFMSRDEMNATIQAKNDDPIHIITFLDRLYLISLKLS